MHVWKSLALGCAALALTACEREVSTPTNSQDSTTSISVTTSDDSDSSSDKPAARARNDQIEVGGYKSRLVLDNQGDDNTYVQDDYDCKRQPNVPWCTNDYVSPTLKVTTKLVKQYDAEAREKFHYVSDEKQFGVGDRWDSHAFEVFHNADWFDDCDGLAETTLDVAYQYGVPKDHMWRMTVNTDNKAKDYDDSDHMVGIIKTDDGHYFVVGDVNNPAYELKDIDYQILRIASVQEGTTWREPTWVDP